MRSRPSVIAAVTAALIAISTLVSPVTGATAAELPQHESAEQRGAPEGSSTRTIPHVPIGVRVETSTEGFTVYATPQCTLATYCKSWVRVLSAQVDKWQVNTRNGYFVRWPSNWAEGTSRSDGVVLSEACDLINCYYNLGRSASVGTITRPYAPRALNVSVASKDDVARTARVQGSATPSASIRLNGDEVAKADSSGTWSHTLTGLSVGTNTRTYQQYVDGTYRDQKPVSVTITDQALTATASHVDPVARTATVSGKAPNRATSIDVVWTRNGVEEKRIVRPSNGSWTLDVDGLVFGQNAVRVEAFAGAQSIGTASVVVDVPAPAFSATASFPDDVTKPVTVGGNGAPGATVVVRDGDDELAHATVDPAGAWSVTLAAPDRGGVRRVEVEQSGAGVPAARASVDIDYGPGVRITSPGNGFVIPPVYPEVRIVGTAAPHAVVRLSEQGVAGSDLGTVTANDAGRWAITTPALEVRNQALLATAKSRGANTTTDTVSLRGQ
ncbi:hypothetical protein [Curtobacterium sp. MCSS17_015]|uniref:hypothetical protein n=1 Tax=Curtobacterium sp. MCSS17_015 TaxID=2175666 RepID=UPI000DA97DF2|nr:hypothetical protein [Curtobacterium sp. MCSS17_015]WIB26935.1 hypothetical protein DEJ18_02250 [Curtobacterium sp. MCSS17_015]